MSPAPSKQHQDISHDLTLQFGIFLQGHPCLLYAAPFDVRLPTPMEDGMTASTVVQPDLMVVCDREQLLDGKSVVGAPTLVVEITSPSTLTKDNRVKRAAYERAGVQEYWIISPVEKTVQVYTLDERGRYGLPAFYTADDQAPVGVLPGLVIDLARVFAER
jgi:Uma2 family endonuclease